MRIRGQFVARAGAPDGANMIVFVSPRACEAAESGSAFDKRASSIAATIGSTFNNHASATAIRRVVDDSVRLRCKVSRVDKIDRNDARLPGFAEQARLEKRGEHFGEQGNDGETH